MQNFRLDEQDTELAELKKGSVLTIFFLEQRLKDLKTSPPLQIKRCGQNYIY